jgi:hypothetical protein
VAARTLDGASSHHGVIAWVAVLIQVFGSNCVAYLTSPSTGSSGNLRSK